MTSNWNPKGWSNHDAGNFYREKDWLKLRKRYIESFPICELSNQYDIVEPAEIIDHIIPRRLCPELEYEWTNLQSLSFLNHQKKTALERNVNTVRDYVTAMKRGKLRYICTEEKMKKLLELVEEKGLI